jgi:hypothetical protein
MPATRLRRPRRPLPDWLMAIPVGVLVAAIVLAVLFLWGIGHAQGAPSIQLTWDYTQASAPGAQASEFILERCAGAACTNFVALPGPPIPVSQLTYTDANNLLPGTTYRWRILAKGAPGVSAPSNAVSFLVPQTPPAAPTHLRAIFVP